jgi:hypothetical protein
LMFSRLNRPHPWSLADQLAVGHVSIALALFFVAVNGAHAHVHYQFNYPADVMFLTCEGVC